LRRHSSRMKWLSVCIFAVIAIAGATAVYIARSANPPEPKRVWVQYFEKYRSGDRESPASDIELFAEKRLGVLIDAHKGCIVLTRERQKADFVANISVIRYGGGGDLYGTASLLITKANGDVVLAEGLYQGRDFTADIAQQPITRVWETLCPAPPHSPKR
jgi:hypothetical protein